MPAWLVLLVRLPPTPSSIRVKAWRRLRAIGAVALKNSVYLLPLSPAGGGSRGPGRTWTGSARPG
jgi:hypothetical protein